MPTSRMLTWRQLAASSLVGTITSSIMCGVVTVQTSAYFSTFPNDSLALKSLVAALWVLPIVQVSAAVDSLWKYLIAAHGVEQSPDGIPWRQYTWHVTGAASASLVQGLFVWRVWQLWKAPYFVGFLAFLVLLASVLSFASTALMALSSISTSYTVALTDAWLIRLWLGISIFNDAVIAAVLSVLLTRQKSGFGSTDTLIKRLIHYTISTGAITVFVSLVTLVWNTSFNIHQLPSMFPGIPYGPSYSLALLTNLLSRTELTANLPKHETIPHTKNSNSQFEHELDMVLSPQRTPTTPRPTPSSATTTASVPSRESSGITRVLGDGSITESNTTR